MLSTSNFILFFCIFLLEILLVGKKFSSFDTKLSKKFLIEFLFVSWIKKVFNLAIVE